MKVSITLAWVTGFVIAASGLFYVTLQVEKLETQLSQLNHKIEAEKDNIHMLEAEWSYFNRPDRIQKLTETILPDLQPVEAYQFIDINRLPFKPDSNSTVTSGSETASAPTIMAPDRELALIRQAIEEAGE